MISDSDVLQMYRLVLGREPEGEAIVAEQMQQESIRSLLWQFLRSDEFLGRQRAAIRAVFHA